MKSKIFLTGLVLALTTAPAVHSAERGYVAHEWGTFTSVQGGNGIQLQWRAAQVSDLPGFVHGLNRLTGVSSNLFFGKGELVALQRMETPVVYFYPSSTDSLKVKTTVGFPAGIVTEWYPQASQFGPYPVTNILHRKESGIEWDVELNPIVENTSEIKLPMDRSGSHYFAARETDSATLRVHTRNQSSELEKFLFYRGVGFLPAPLRVQMAMDGAITMTNSGAETLKHLFVLRVKNGKGSFSHLSSLKAAEQTVVVNNSNSRILDLDKLSTALGDQLIEALQEDGLYRREAIAMVNTWKDSWFTEEGIRVLYILPRNWTDATLPIQFSPAPDSLVRVMVGRAEIISPEIELQLRSQLVKASSGDSQARDALSRQLTLLGRFANPAVQVASKGLDPAVLSYGWNAASLAERSETH